MIKKGLREKITNVSDGTLTELTEDVVDEFVENVPMARRLQTLRSRTKPNKKDSLVDVRKKKTVRSAPVSDSNSLVNSVKGEVNAEAMIYGNDDDGDSIEETSDS